VSDVILDSMDCLFGQLIERLSGLTDEEYLWEPRAGMWSVRQRERGSQTDGAGERDVDPPPVTTIAWRLWHISIDCFDDYTLRFGGGTADASAAWTMNAQATLSNPQRPSATLSDPQRQIGELSQPRDWPRLVG
tara:strand:- start:239 stop:640 length:402 start_codon:yes stop_codon:yes gene_type:complete